MSLCPKIWSIQFEFTPEASRLVWRYFLRLCADTFGSLIRVKAFLTTLDSVFRGIRFTVFNAHVRNSGLLSLKVSGGNLLVPCWRALMYSLSAWIASGPMKVFAVVLTFCVMRVMGINSLPFSSCSRMSP